MVRLLCQQWPKVSSAISSSTTQSAFRKQLRNTKLQEDQLKNCYIKLPKFDTSATSGPNNIRPVPNPLPHRFSDHRHTFSQKSVIPNLRSYAVVVNGNMYIYVCVCVCVCVYIYPLWAGWLSRYSDYGLDGPGSNPGGDEIFRPSRPALGTTQPPVHWVLGLSRG